MTTQLQERAFSAEERRALAAKGHALPDGSFPIENEEDVHNAIRLAGNADDPGKARAHIKKRAAALGKSSLIPDSWKEADTSTTQDVRLIETEVLEAETRQLGGKHVVEVTLIRAGTSKNGNSYPIHVLRESVPLFEGSRAFADHPTDDDRPERSVRDLVGYYRNAQLNESTEKVRAELHLIPGNDWLWHLLQESQSHPDLCGLSIDAAGSLESTSGARVVKSINGVSSVDIVTRPAAGGSFDRILQSHNPHTKGNEMPTATQTEEEKKKAEEEATKLKEAEAKKAEEEADKAKAEAEAKKLQEAKKLEEAKKEKDNPTLSRLVETQQADLKKAQDELTKVQSILDPNAGNGNGNGKGETAADELSKLAEEMKRDRDLTKAEATLSTKLQEAILPEPVEKKIRSQFEGQIFETEKLELAISQEKSMLAELTKAGLVTGQGFEKATTLGMSEYDQLQAAMDGLFDIYESEAAKTLPKLSGIREAFKIATGVDVAHLGGADRPLLETYQAGLKAKARSGNLSESEVILRETDVTTSSFSYLLGTSMNKRLLADYQAWPSEWQKFSTIVGIKDFKQQDRIRLGAFGSLSTVAEDGPYTTLTLADTRATYTPTKRGNLVQITRETIVNDDLYAIKQIPQKLAVAAAFTLAEFVYNLLAPSFGNIYDSHNLFDSINHLNTGVIAANLGTANSGAALSSAALQAAVVKMRKQQNLASKPIGLKPRYLLVPPDLEFTAMTILKSAGLPGGNNNDINPMMGYAEPIVAPQLNATTAGPASTTIWIAVADPRVIDTVEVGFIGGQANPVLLIQDMPLYGLNFTQDTISYKVRHEYGGAVVDYRGFYLGNN